MGRSLRVVALGRLGYAEGVAMQEAARARVLDGDDEVLFLVEHAPVVTLGRRAGDEALRVPSASLAARGVELHRTSRGGEATYHGPGQLVAYAIVRLDSGVAAHVAQLAEAAVRLAADVGVNARYDRARPGVWVGARKLACIGVHVHRGVAMHGLALNLSPVAVAGYASIVPCGMGDVVMTSLVGEGAAELSVAEAGERYARAFVVASGRSSIAPAPLAAALEARLVPRGPRRALRVAVLYNRDAGAAADVASVEEAALDVRTALEEAGHSPSLFAVEGEAIGGWVGAIDAMRAASVELVFNLCEAVGGRTAHEPVVPHLLELAGLQYTGSGPLALGLALRKDRARLLLASAGVPIAAGVAYDAPPRHAPPLVFPLIAKLAAEDASVGIDRGSVVRDLPSLRRRVAALLASHAGPVLVEEYVAGREIYVSLLGPKPRALPPHEIDFSAMPADCPRIVTYAGKWETGSLEDLGSRPIRARKLGPLGKILPAIAVRAFHALGLRDYARIDFRVDGAGRPYVIDVNPNCDLSAGAGVARAASFAGLTHAQLIDEICRSAWTRRPGRGSKGAR